MTKPREWGNNVKEARDRSAELAARASRMLKPLLDDRQPTEIERLRRISIALTCVLDILRILEASGACTRPVEED